MAGRWIDLKTTEFAALDADKTVVVQPLGAIEQHGPHLPISTDAVIAEELCKRAVLGMGDAPVLLLPVQHVGKSNEHLAYPGTLTLSAHTLIDVWTEIGESVSRAGLKKLVFVNAHGGQPQIMEVVARELRVRHQMMAVSSSWWHMGFPDDLIPADEQKHGIHGGLVETSLMLHFVPNLVRMEHAEDFSPAMKDLETEADRLKYLGGVGMGWMAQDIHPAGVAGNASAATSDIGKAIADHVIDGLKSLFAEVSEFPLDRIKGR
ncbi:MAG: creatininase family protein [Pseudomonadota bacterium]